MIDQKTLEVLTILANKLGTTTEYLWEMLLKQAFISGLLDLFICIFLILVTIFWCITVFRNTRESIDSNGNVKKPKWTDSEGVGLAWTLVAVLSIFTFFVVLANIDNIVTAFIHPEFWALKQVLKVL